MKKIHLILLWVLFVCLPATAQKQTSNSMHEDADAKMLAIPAGQTNQIESITKYINLHFTTHEEKIRAVYVWIIHNINYDIPMMNEVQTETNAYVVAANTLKTKKGVCYHFACLFKALAEQMGIPTHCIGGYTKKEGKLINDSHIWCASQLGTVWYFFDPTWGAGYIQNRTTFVRHPNFNYFKVLPRQMQASHMPFDPMWQMVDYPLQFQEFDRSVKVRTDSIYFNWKDSLSRYVQKDELEQWSESQRRTERNGELNSIVREDLETVRRNIDITSTNRKIAIYNDALKQFNQGIGELNTFIVFRNNHFKPEKEQTDVQEMISICRQSFNEAEKKLASIATSNEELLGAIRELKPKIQSALQMAKEQQDFVDKYYSTDKLLRKTLFYKLKSSQ